MTISEVGLVGEHASVLEDKVLVTISMEGYVPELDGDAREANTRGGLGIYFGDKLEGLHAIGMDSAFGCMPLYQKRLVQSIRHGKQHIEYRDVSYEDQPLEPVTDGEGKPMRFDVWGWDTTNTAQNRQYSVEVYTVCRGGTDLYLFSCPDVFDVLYPDDRTHHGHGREHRFLQEIVFAECVYEFFKQRDTVPDILHLNEGHVAAAAAILRGDKAFDKTAVVYTNHTVVRAGMEVFSVERLTGGDVARARYAMRFPWPNHQRFWRKFSVQHGDQWFIDFSKGAIEMCDAANGVSSEHAVATQALFPTYDRKIEPVLNGSGSTWVMDDLLEDKIKGADSSKETLRRIGAKGRERSLAEVRKRTVGMTAKNGRVVCRRGASLDPELPTIWMVRRMVEYKSQLPILKDIIHVICANRDEEVNTVWGKMKGLEMQVVVGGLAPEGSDEERWIEEFIDWMQRPELKGRFVYVPNADTILLKMQAIGADICINCPLPELEACGTSDQRSAMNGGINIATQSGGPPEYIEDGKGGMLVGPYRDKEDFHARAPKDILEALGKLSEMYYGDADGDGAWIEMKMQSYLSSLKVSALAMEQRYAELYAQAMRTRTGIIHSVSLARPESRHGDQISDIMLKLHEAARGFLYLDPELAGWTVIAGSPYFDQRQGGHLYNWGRDTMISLPGLCQERQRFELFKDVLKNYLGFVRNGMLPNLIGDGSEPRYNSVDASFWLFWAVGKYLDYTADHAFMETMIDRRLSSNQTGTVQEILEEIIESCRKGIEYEDTWRQGDKQMSQTIRIFMDSDGLICAGDDNTQLTWMDAKPTGCKPVTSRHGKAVEINALWYNALKVMDDVRRKQASGNTEYGQLAEKVKSSFGKFWNEKTRCLYDTIDGDEEQGRKIRPNQLFAVALGLLDDSTNRAIMARVRQELLTPCGLRTLSPRDPDYHDVHENEYSYHQGTVWPWLIGAFTEGCLVTYGKRTTLRILDGVGYLDTLSEILQTFGSIPEVFDGSSDSIRRHGHGKGCESQAWNVGESLRGLSLLLSADSSQEEDAAKGTGLIYEMVVRDYYDSEENKSGLAVALAELSFLAESGVEYIYLLGLISHTGNPFDIMNPQDIDPRAGSFEDLDDFLSSAHRLGMKVIVDWLANQHVSKQSDLCKRHPDWFLYTDAPDGDYYFGKGMLLCTGREVKAGNKNLFLVSATDEVPLRAFPRRWTSLAQPDLSHPEVRGHALETGLFWLAKGLDGFRIDAALSTFPDKIKENWGLDVEENLTRLLIQEARKINPDCFIMFEGFERMEELLQLADYEHCGVYNWRLRNLTTDAIGNAEALAALTAYLKDIEHVRQLQDEMVHLGPEHDAFDFADPWAQLDYSDRLFLYFLYTFLPGYMLVFNGELSGQQHNYKRQPEETLPAPRSACADRKKKAAAKRLFGLRREFPQLVTGDYKCLANVDPNIVCLARFDRNQIVIGVINTTESRKDIAVSLPDIIAEQRDPAETESASYAVDTLVLNNDAESWASDTRSDISFESLVEEGLHLEIASKSCQIVRVRRIK